MKVFVLTWDTEFMGVYGILDDALRGGEMNSDTFNKLRMDYLDAVRDAIIDESVPDGIVQVRQDLTVEQFLNRHERRKRAAEAKRLKTRR